MPDISLSIGALESHLVWSGNPADPSAVIGATADPDFCHLLKKHDGLAAFDGSLRVFGGTDLVIPSIATWNRPDGWRAGYEELPDSLLFFAEDAFGNQFGFANTRIVRFLAETGEREFVADSFSEWLRLIIADPEEELSLWLVRSWMAAGNTMALNEHLCPKVPFVAGGPYEPENLYALDRLKSMNFKADFARQIKNVPDGGKIRIKTVE